ncbi:hypothetical protein TNCV_2075961 [Trichonephila clavipes]|nr:hypothetical protein TNCV_2075961 [Trichonephila clavipes]
MPCGRHRASFDQASEFDRGRIVAYRDCGLSLREIGQRVRRKKQQRYRRKRRTIGTDHTHLVALLLVMTGGLFALQ